MTKRLVTALDIPLTYLVLGRVGGVVVIAYKLPLEPQKVQLKLAEGLQKLDLAAPQTPPIHDR